MLPDEGAVVAESPQKGYGSPRQRLRVSPLLFGLLATAGAAIPSVCSACCWRYRRAPRSKLLVREVVFPRQTRASTKGIQECVS